VYESIAKEDMRGGLLADEDPRETLIQAEQLGSALSDDVVSPVIRPCKFRLVKTHRIQKVPPENIVGFHAHVAQPGVPDEPGFGSLGWSRPQLCIKRFAVNHSRAHLAKICLWTAGALACAGLFPLHRQTQSLKLGMLPKRVARAEA
jgi:hypothetical protein